MTVFDITGEPVNQQNSVSTSSTVDVSRLDKGVYIVEVQGEHTYVQQFIKR